MTIYDNIKDLAEAKGISIRCLEQKAGIANGVVRKWNEYNPTVKALKAVADVLNVTVDELIAKN